MNLWAYIITFQSLMRLGAVHVAMYKSVVRCTSSVCMRSTMFDNDALIQTTLTHPSTVMCIDSSVRRLEAPRTLTSYRPRSSDSLNCHCHCKTMSE